MDYVIRNITKEFLKIWKFIKVREEHMAGGAGRNRSLWKILYLGQNISCVITFMDVSSCTLTNYFLHLIIIGKDYFNPFKNDFHITFSRIFPKTYFPESKFTILKIKKKLFRKGYSIIVFSLPDFLV